MNLVCEERMNSKKERNSIQTALSLSDICESAPNQLRLSKHFVYLSGLLLSEISALDNREKMYNKKQAEFLGNS